MPRFLLLAALLAAASPVFAEDAPQVLLATQLGLLPGETTKLTLRGLKLDGASEVLVASDKVQVKLLGKGAASVPNKQEATKVGNTQVEIEVVVPADFPPGVLEFRVKVGDQETPPYAIEVGGSHPIVSEKEGNDGFRQAQAIAHPQVVLGSIQGPQDVDVFVVEVQAGQKLAVEVFAARRGSGLDAWLAIYDAKGQLVASGDDLPDSRDARVAWTAPAAGRYYVALSDAHDQGGLAHAYRLVVSPAP